MLTKITKSLRSKSFLSLIITAITLLASGTSYAEDTKPCYCSCLLDQARCRSWQYNKSEAWSNCREDCEKYYDSDKTVASYCSEISIDKSIEKCEEDLKVFKECEDNYMKKGKEILQNTPCDKFKEYWESL